MSCYELLSALWVNKLQIVQFTIYKQITNFTINNFYNSGLKGLKNVLCKTITVLHKTFGTLTITNVHVHAHVTVMHKP